MGPNKAITLIAAPCSLKESSPSPPALEKRAPLPYSFNGRAV